MPNELLIILSFIIIYGSTILFYRLFGKGGLLAFNVLATLIANIEVLLLVRAFGVEMTLGNVLFASTFLVTDILSENHGKKIANLTGEDLIQACMDVMCLTRTEAIEYMEAQSSSL